MELLPAAAALAVILITAGFIMRTAPSQGVKHRARSHPAPTGPSIPAIDDATPTPDPWVVEPEPLIVQDVPTGPHAGPAPVLAYVESPRRSPDPERLIQTEVLVQSGTVARAWRAGRLLVSLLVLGAVLGFGSVALVRAAIWLLT